MRMPTSVEWAHYRRLAKIIWQICVLLGGIIHRLGVILIWCALIYVAVTVIILRLYNDEILRYIWTHFPPP